MLVVHRYGGTSLGSLERIRGASEKIIAYKKKGKDMVVVVSAMSGETDGFRGLRVGFTNFPTNGRRRPYLHG